MTIRRTNPQRIPRLAPFRRPLASLAFIAPLLGPLAAAALAAAAVRPPMPEDPGDAPTWLYYLVAVVAALICVGIAVIPGRRNADD